MASRRNQTAGIKSRPGGRVTMSPAVGRESGACLEYLQETPSTGPKVVEQEKWRKRLIGAKQLKLRFKLLRNDFVSYAGVRYEVTMRRTTSGGPWFR